MRLHLFSILSLFMLACSQPKENAYLQDNQVSLVAPRIISSSTIIDSSVHVSAALRLDGVEIFYTEDETTPTQVSLRYTEKLEIEEDGIYRFKAFHPDFKASPISEIKLYQKGFIPNRMKWHTTANKSYPGAGDSTFMNRTKGSTNFRDLQWAGFDSVAKATVYFEEKPFIKTLTIGYLIDTKSWIFPPKGLSVLINSRDTIHMEIDPLKEIDMIALNDVQIPINMEVESIVVEVFNTSKLPEWHPGKGLKAWLFMDEWIFN